MQNIVADRAAATEGVSTRALVGQLGVLFSARLLLTTARRMAYTFAIVFSRGLGVPLTSITSLIALTQLTGFLAPIFGVLGDRWGYRLVMVSGVGTLSFGFLLGGLSPGYATLFLAFTLAGVCQVAVDPLAQAYTGELVPYHRRGLAIGLIELAWAGSTLVGIPVVGLLIDKGGWQAPLLVLGGLAFVPLVAMLLVIPPDERRTSSRAASASSRELLKRIITNRSVWGALGFTFLLCTANDTLFVVYGAWLEAAFGLNVLSLGAATMVIGLAEVLGTGLVAMLSDRLGLSRAVLVGAVLVMLSYLSFLLAGSALPVALGSMFVVFVLFEWTIVTSFAFLSEMVPYARGSMMSANTMAASLGRMVGALAGGVIWLAGGIRATAVVAALATALAVICLLFVLRRE